MKNTNQSKHVNCGENIGSKHTPQLSQTENRKDKEDKNRDQRIHSVASVEDSETASEGLLNSQAPPFTPNSTPEVPARSYSGVAQSGMNEYPWKKVEKPQRKNSTLRGAQQLKTIQMYVKNIEIDSKHKVEQAEEKVRKYLLSKEIRVYKAQVIKNRFVDTVVGCKITIAENQKCRLEQPYFWPEHIECRPWGRKNVRYNVRERSNDHYESEDHYRRRHDDYYEEHSYDRHYDNDKNDNEFWWEGGYDRH